jgi:WW domain
VHIIKLCFRSSRNNKTNNKSPLALRSPTIKAITDMMNMMDTIADFMISIVTNYGTAVGCDQMIGAALGEDEHGKDKTVKTQSQQQQQQQQQADHHQSNVLESLVESKAVICFECGVAGFRSYTKSTTSNDDGDGDSTINKNDDKDLRKIVYSHPGTDMVFFPTPSSEIPFFRKKKKNGSSHLYQHHLSSAAVTAAAARSLTQLTQQQSDQHQLQQLQTSHLKDSLSKMPATTTQQQLQQQQLQSINKYQIPLVRVSHISSPPPEVADRWLKMGGGDDDIDDDDEEDEMCAFDEISIGGNVSPNGNDNGIGTKTGNDTDNDFRNVPFDEELTVNIKSLAETTLQQAPAQAPASRRPPLHELYSSRSSMRSSLRDYSSNSNPSTVFYSHMTRTSSNCPRSASAAVPNQCQLQLQQQPQHQQQQRQHTIRVHSRHTIGGDILRRDMPSKHSSASSIASSASGGEGTGDGGGGRGNNTSSATTKSSATGTESSHWKSAVDPKSGRTYYYHEVTRETQWRKPMELATDEEKRAMEEKERKQKDFFAAMEANILNAVSQGVVPGTPQPGSGNNATGFGRRKSSRKISMGPDGRPELVRTISTMDELVLKDLIRRQPSYRNIKPGLSKEESLRVEDLQSGPSRTSSTVREFGDSWSHSSHNVMPTLEESVRELTMDDGHDSMPALFNYVPDEDPSNSRGDYDDESVSLHGDIDVDGDDDELNKSSLTGFGLTWDETQALKKLASITKDMIDSENTEYDLESDASRTNSMLRSSAGTTPSFRPAAGGKNATKRDLPREVDFDDDSSYGNLGETPDAAAGKTESTLAPTLQKAAENGSDGRALPRELEFDDSDEEEDDDDSHLLTPRNETPLQSTGNKTSSGDKTRGMDLARPGVKRRNTCATMYVGTTMSAPDKDATIKCICGVFRSHILSSNLDTLYNPDTDPYKIFNDHESDQSVSSASGSIRQSRKSKAAPVVPSLDEITKFYRDVFFKAQMEADCIIMSLIYVERLIKKTAGRLRPRSTNWHSLLFSCMILSSKVWDDLSMVRTWQHPTPAFSHLFSLAFMMC